MWKRVLFAALLSRTSGASLFDDANSDLEKRFAFNPAQLTRLPLSVFTIDSPNPSAVPVAVLPDGDLCELTSLSTVLETVTEQVTITVTDPAPAASANNVAVALTISSATTTSISSASSDPSTSTSATSSTTTISGPLQRRIVQAANDPNFRARPAHCPDALPPQTLTSQTTLKETVTFHVTDTPPPPTNVPPPAPVAVNDFPSVSQDPLGKGAVSNAGPGLAAPSNSGNPPAAGAPVPSPDSVPAQVTRVADGSNSQSPGNGAPAVTPAPAIVPATTIGGVALSVAPPAVGTGAPAIVIQGQTITPPPAGAAATTYTAANGIAVTLSGSVVAVGGQSITVATGTGAAGALGATTTGGYPYQANYIGFYIAATRTPSVYGGPVFQGAANREVASAAGWLGAFAGLVAAIL